MNSYELFWILLYHRAPIFHSKMKCITGGLQGNPDDWVDRIVEIWTCQHLTEILTYLTTTVLKYWWMSDCFSMDLNDPYQSPLKLLLVTQKESYETDGLIISWQGCVHNVHTKSWLTSFIFMKRLQDKVVFHIGPVKLLLVLRTKNYFGSPARIWEKLETTM